jgi:2-haloacid dehalogenase/putative hydrolase of the HAD superfamily
MSRYEGIFLDFYGTLASGDGWLVESLCQQVVQEHRLKVAAADLAGLWGDRYFAAIEALNGDGFRLLHDIERDTLVEVLAPFDRAIDVTPYIDQLNAYLARPSLFDEVRDVLNRLSLPVCIVSNADEKQLQPAIAYHDLPVQSVVSSEAARCYKPSPKIFKHALELTGWSADRVLHVGDSLHSDVAGAHAAGLRAAWVCRAGRIKDIGTDQPDFRWSDLRPLLTLRETSP